MGDKAAVMKAEAINIMRLLGFDRKTIFEFEHNGNILMSIEGRKPQEIGEAERILIDDFEREGRYKVFHVVSGGVNGIGYCKNLLYVSTYKEDYEVLEYQAMRKLAMAYVYNETFPDSSEPGFISLATVPYIVRIG